LIFFIFSDNNNKTKEKQRVNLLIFHRNGGFWSGNKFAVNSFFDQKTLPLHPKNFYLNNGS